MEGRDRRQERRNKRQAWKYWQEITEARKKAAIEAACAVSHTNTVAEEGKA